MTSTLKMGNLPQDLTRFVGRRGELADARREMAESRLVTLTGIGGVGKTRLALHLARDLARTFRDGAWLADMGSLHDPGLVAETIANALGLRDGGGQSGAAALTNHVRDRQLLLVVDNCEHLLDPIAVVLESMLQASVYLRVVCTSRQPLGVPGERVLVVPPLSVPDVGGPTPSPDSIGHFDAVALFVDRASAGSPTFALTADNAAAVATLVWRLDGIPLAIELAAARMRVLTPAQVVSRLDDGYAFLASADRTAIPHQSSLNALIDWSFGLCTPNERVLWSRLSMFPQDFDLEAAEHVCSGNGLERGTILNTLAGLVDKSVLVPERHSDQIRYRLPQTIREYGRAQLTEQERQDVPRRHSDYYRRVGSRAWQEWFGPSQVRWTAWMQSEHVNLLSALEFGVDEPGRLAVALELVPALAFYWASSGSMEEGRRVLGRFLALHPEPSRGRAVLTCLAVWLATAQGDLDAVEIMAEESRRLCIQFDDLVSFGHATVHLAAARMAIGDRTAQELFQEVLDLPGLNADVKMKALCGAAELAGSTGDLERASAYLREAVELSERNCESWERGAALCTWALIVWRSGDTDRALGLVRESLRLRSAFSNRLGIANSVEVQAWVESDHERAAVLLGCAALVRRAVGASIPAEHLELHQQCEAKLRTGLGEKRFLSTMESAANKPLDEIVAYALGEQTVKPVQRGKAPLTRRELQVAALVEQGLSNRQIAAQMVIAQRTAEGHVENILSKLGFTARTQIASWVAEKRLTSE